MIIVVSPKGSHIFVTPEARNNLENLLYCIPNCSVFCPTEAEYEDKERLDLLRIAQFYLMT